MTKAKFVEWKIPPSMIYVEVDRTWDESFQKGTITCTCPHCETDREMMRPSDLKDCHWVYENKKISAIIRTPLHPTKEYAYAPIYCFYCYRDYYVKDSETLANDPSSSVPDVEKIEWPVDLTYPNGVSDALKEAGTFK